MGGARLALVGLIALLAAPAVALDWQPTHRTKTYTITGDSGIALYRAIGERGPVVGVTRAIGLTEWDLKWRRDYRPEAGGCRIGSVTPFLVITTTLPRASGLDPVLQAKWDRFVSGIAAHESVHSRFLIDFVDRIIAETRGLRLDNDPDCSQTRDEVQRRVKALYGEYRATNAAFEQAEMADGGAVRRLILDLVN